MLQDNVKVWIEKKKRCKQHKNAIKSFVYSLNKHIKYISLYMDLYAPANKVQISTQILPYETLQPQL